MADDDELTSSSESAVSANFDHWGYLDNLMDCSLVCESMLHCNAIVWKQDNDYYDDIYSAGNDEESYLPGDCWLDGEGGVSDSIDVKIPGALATLRSGADYGVLWTHEFQAAGEPRNTDIGSVDGPPYVVLVRKELLISQGSEPSFSRALCVASEVHDYESLRATDFQGVTLSDLSWNLSGSTLYEAEVSGITSQTWVERLPKTFSVSAMP